MKYMMMVALLSGAVCVAGDYVAPQARVLGQEMIMNLVALDVVVGNLGGAHTPKPKHSAMPLSKKDPQYFNHAKKQKNYSTHHRHGYSGRK